MEVFKVRVESEQLEGEVESIRKAIELATDRLFTNGVGEHAERLVLTSASGKDLGGWCKKAVVDQLIEAIAPEGPKARKERD